MVLSKTNKTDITFHNKFIRFLTKTSTCLILVLFLFTPHYSEAVTDEEQLQLLNEQITTTKEKLNDIYSKERSLEDELEAFNLQISSIQLKINASQAEINLLKKQIAATDKQIRETENELAHQKEIMKEYLRTMYMEGQVSTLELIAKSESFSDFIDRSEYLNTMQQEVQNTANEILLIKARLDAEKKDQETKKAKAEQLKAQQLAQRNELALQRDGRQHLLDITEGSETKYKSYLSDLQRKFNELQEEIWRKATGGYVSLGHVNRGDVIGYIGNSGYSTGCHLHFEMRTTPTTHVNPANYLGNGYFTHPTPGVYMSAPYGYSSYYFPGVFHTGQDYADGCARTAIKAAAPGDIILRVTGRTDTYPWSLEYGNYVMIRHTNGMYTLYAHME